MSDYGFREYQTLLARVLVANNHVDIASVASRVTKFAQDEEANPVYIETLVNLLMAQGYKVIAAAIDGVDNDTYALMATRLITRHVSITVGVWQRTMEHNASGTEE